MLIEIGCNCDATMATTFNCDIGNDATNTMWGNSVPVFAGD